ncbi:MAG: hypothetical protein ACRENJ_09780 [Candidatus Eiseniibacteriota bacterium]
MNRPPKGTIRIGTAIAIAAGIVSASTSAFAVPWELHVQLVGPGANAMQIRVCETATGSVVGTFWSNDIQSADDFTVDFNGQSGADIQLTVDVTYTFTFVGWGKSCYVSGNMPPGQPSYDDSWVVDGNANTVTHISGPNLQRVYGFPGATCALPPGEEEAATRGSGPGPLPSGGAEARSSRLEA